MRQEQAVLNDSLGDVRVGWAWEFCDEFLAKLVVGRTIAGFHQETSHPVIVIMVVWFQLDKESRFGCCLLPSSASPHEIKHLDEKILVRRPADKRGSL